MATAGQPPMFAIDSPSIDPSPRPLKRRRRTIVPDPPVYNDAPAVLPAEMVAGLLNRSAAVVMKSVGFDGATAVAQERLRQLAEDYYLQMLHTVQLFARAQRRTRPTVLDFQDMLTNSHISLSSLEDELKRIPSKSHPFVPPPPSPPPHPAPDLSSLLGPELVGGGGRDKRKYVYDHLPPFPSKHTYINTPVFTERPIEPRMIRERATEEARLAENALRKLLAVSAASKDLENSQSGAVVGDKRKQRDEAWRKAFDGLSPDGNVAGKPNGIASGMLAAGKGKAVEGEGDSGYLEVIVNADSQFWRKGTPNAKRRRTTTTTTTPGAV